MNQALTLNPRYADAYNTRGVVNRRKGNVDAAIHDYDSAIALQPDYTFAFNNRAYAYLVKGDFGKAVRDATKRHQD